MADYTLVAKLTADAKNFVKGFGQAQSKLADLQGKVNTFGKKFQNIGKEISRVGDSLTRKITAPALGAASALTGITLVKGFNRLVGIDTAQAKLEALGHNAKNVEDIMNSALQSVRGTAFGMDEAATTAANAVAAGIPLGKELTRYLSLTGDAAAIAGASMSEMGSIINKVSTAGKAYNSELQMLSDRGLPIYQWLAKEANTTADAVFKMASDGKISSEMLLNAIENNIGGAAKIMGEKSFTAAVANIGADISRIGAAFLDAGGEAGGFFSTVKPLLTEFREYLQSIEPIAADLGVKFGEGFNKFIDTLRDLKARFDALDPSVQKLILKGAGIGTALAVGIGPVIGIVGRLVSGFGTVATVLSFLLSPVGLIVGALVGLGVAFATALIKSEDFRNKVMAAFEFIRDIVTQVIDTLKPILSTMFDSAMQGISTFADGVGSKLLNAFELIGTVISTVIDVIGQFVSSIVDGFKSAGGEVNTLSSLFIGFNPVLKLVMLLLTEFGPQIAQGFSQIASMVVPILTLLGQTLGELAAAIIPLVMNVISTLIPIIMQLGTAIFDIVSRVLPILLEIFNQLVPVVMSLVTTVISLIGQIFPLVSVIIDALVPVLMTLVDLILNIVQAVAPALIAIIGAVIAIFQAVVPVVVAILTVVVEVVAGIISAITPIIAFIAGIITTIISIIAPIVTFIAGIIASIFNVITPIISFATGVFTTVFSIISSNFRKAQQFITTVINTISKIISGLSSIVSGVFNRIFSIISKIMNNVSNRITNVFTAIKNAWNGLTSFVSGVFNGISSAVSSLVGQVKGFVNGVIGGVNAAIGLINKIPGVNISRIPYLYRGTDDWQGGFARINEGGRGELVLLPDGTQVIPHDVSMRYAREAGRQQAVRSQHIISSNNDSRENRPSGDIVFNVDGYEFARIQKPYLDEMFGEDIDLTGYMRGERE